MRLLLAEDDAMIGEAVRTGLRKQGFTVDWVSDGVAAQQALATEPYEACVLDLGLPRRTGLAVLRELRERGSTLPVLVLTARECGHRSRCRPRCRSRRLPREAVRPRGTRRAIARDHETSRRSRKASRWNTGT
jgi:CheY-like chemotaxis protein